MGENGSVSDHPQGLVLPPPCTRLTSSLLCFTHLPEAASTPRIHGLPQETGGTRQEVFVPCAFPDKLKARLPWLMRQVQLTHSLETLCAARTRQPQASPVFRGTEHPPVMCSGSHWGILRARAGSCRGSAEERGCELMHKRCHGHTAHCRARKCPNFTFPRSFDQESRVLWVCLQCFAHSRQNKTKLRCPSAPPC